MSEKTHTSDACFGCETPWSATGKKGCRPGQLIVCKNCGAVMLLDQDLRLRTMTAAEHRAVESNAELMASIAAMLIQANVTKHVLN